MLELSWFVCNGIYFILYCYLFSTLVCKEKFELKKEIIFFSILMSLVYIFITKMNYIYIRPYFIQIYILLALKKIYNKPFMKIIIGLLCITFLVLISELIYDFVIVFILEENPVNLNKMALYNFMTNIFIFLICYLLSFTLIVKKIITSIVDWYSENELKSLIIFVLFFLIIATFVLYTNFVKLLPSSFLFITNLFCIGVFVFVLGYFKEKTNNNRIVSEYEQLLSYVKVYERTIEEKSKNQHEYKNQLILIKGMLNKNNKKASNYIDDIICNQSSDDNLELLRKLQYLPQGGLKGLIYYKVEEMISNGIDVYIDISPKLNKPKVTKIINENLHDLSKIIGVYLDNAIEAVRNVENKYIVIEANVEKNNIIFSFSNTYNGHIDLSKLDKEGYTTKGQGKGYGLPLVKDIINNNETFEQSRQINGPYYVQKLYIKK